MRRWLPRGRGGSENGCSPACCPRRDLGCHGRCLEVDGPRARVAMVPQLARAAIMYNPNSVPAGGKFFSRPFNESATKLKVRPITAEVHDPSEIENAIMNLGREPESGLVLVPDNFMSVH